MSLNAHSSKHNSTKMTFLQFKVVYSFSRSHDPILVSPCYWQLISQHTMFSSFLLFWVAKILQCWKEQNIYLVWNYQQLHVCSEYTEQYSKNHWLLGGCITTLHHIILLVGGGCCSNFYKGGGIEIPKNYTFILVCVLTYMLNMLVAIILFCMLRMLRCSKFRTGRLVCSKSCLCLLLWCFISMLFVSGYQKPHLDHNNRFEVVSATCTIFICHSYHYDCFYFWLTQSYKKYLVGTFSA